MEKKEAYMKKKKSLFGFTCTLLLAMVMSLSFFGSCTLAEEADFGEDIILEEDNASMLDATGIEETEDADSAAETKKAEGAEAVTEETNGETEIQTNDGISVVSIEDVESDVQTISTDTVTELEANKTYYISDILNTWQYFTVSGAGRVQFILENCTNPSSYTLYMYIDTDVSQNLKLLTSLEGATSYYASLSEGRQYSFKISGKTTTTNSEATLYIKYEPAGSYDGEVESNDSFDTANQISLNSEYYGVINGMFDYDYYQFTLNEPSKVSISLEFYDGSKSNNGLAAYLYSEDSNGNTNCLYSAEIDDEYGVDFSNLRLPAGNYFVVIRWYHYNTYVPYQFVVAGSVESSDAYEIEKNDLVSQANSKNVNTWYDGNINNYKSNGGSSDIDWFSYSVTEKSYLTIELKTPRDSSGTVTATLYRLESNGAMTELDTVTSGSNPYTSSEKGLYEAGAYYVKITGSSANWDYSICLTQEEYIPLTGITIQNSVQLKVGGKAYLSAAFTPSNASEQGVTWTSSNTSVATVDEYGTVTALKLGQATITATSSFSDSSNVKASCTIYVAESVKLSISSATNTSSGIKLAWKKVSGASGYYVYRKTSSGSYSLIKTIEDGSTVSYTDKTIKSNNGTTYTYKVVPYSNYIAGSGSGKTITRLTGTTLSSVKNSSSKKITVKWSKKTNITGYQIQYSTSSSFSSGNKTKKVSGASTKSYKISGLTKGKTYYVRIRTYKNVSGKTYYSAWSSKKSVKITK